MKKLNVKIFKYYIIESPISPCFDQNNQEDNKLVDFARLEDNQTSIKRGNLPPLKEYCRN